MNGLFYIPTMDRVSKQLTLQSIPASHRDRVRLVCPPSEVAAHERTSKVKALACPAKGIAATRQWICDHTLDQHGEAVCTMIDDDHVFFKRIGDTVKLTSMTPAEVGALLDEMEALCMIYPMVGLCARQGNNTCEEPYLSVADRVFNQYAVDAAVLRRERIRFDRTPVMEDFYVNLSLLTRGYPTAKVVDRVWNQPASNAPGGCSSYRSATVQADAACFLAMEFPRFVKVVEKVTKNDWFGEGKRLDVRVQWKKALEWGILKGKAVL